MQLAHNIEALASKGDLTFAAVGTSIVVCKRAHRCYTAIADLTNALSPCCAMSHHDTATMQSQAAALGEVSSVQQSRAGSTAALARYHDELHSDIPCPTACRHGSYKGHTGGILQLLVLGDYLLSLGHDRKLLVWKIGACAEPEVGLCDPCMARYPYTLATADAVQLFT